MKKITLLLAMMIAGFANAQTLHVSVIDDIVVDINYFCADTLVIHADPTCFHPVWRRQDLSEVLDGVFQLVVTENEHQGGWVYEDSNGANIWFDVYISSPTSNAFNPFDAPFVWKRPGDTITLGNPELDFLEFQWSTDETTPTIDVVDDGTYSVEVNDPCGPRTFSIEVRNSVELFRATTELEHNRNQATWQTTPEQAEYVQEVNVYRNNQLVATVPYTDGVFTDDIGSADAPWQYHLVAVSNGEECPLRSYWARTISMSDLMGSQGTQTLSWTRYEQENPAKGDEVQSYGIFDVVGGNPRLVMEVGSFVNMYNYDPSNFDGYAAVAAIFSRDGKSPLDFEDCAFSNRTEAPLGLGEHETATFSVYPNPSNGVFTVEGAGMMTVMNVLGQIIKETEIDGQYIMELPQGIYFVKMGDETRKIVVE